MAEQANQQLLVSVATDRATAEQTARTFTDQRASTEQLIKTFQNLKTTADSTRTAMLALNKDAASTSEVFQRLSQVSALIGRDQAVDDLARQFAELGRITGDDETALQNLVQAMREVGASSVEIERATRAFQDYGNAAQSGGGVTGARSFLTGAAALMGGGPASEILRTTEDLNRLTTGFQQLSSAGFGPLLAELGPMALVAGGVTLAVNAFNAEMEKQKAALQEEIQIRQELRDLVRTATTEEAQARRDKAAQDLKDAQDELERQRAEYRQKTGLDAGEILLPAIRSALSPEILQLGSSINTQIGKVASLQKEYDGLNSALDKNAFALNDRIKQIEALGPAQQKWNDMLSESSKQVEERIQKEQQALSQTQGTIRALEDLAQTTGDPQAINELNKYHALMDQQFADIKTMIDVILPQIKAREVEEEAIKRQNEALKEAAKDFNELAKSLQDYRKLGDEIAQFQADRAKQLQQQAEDDARNAARAAVEKDFAARLASAKREDEIQKVKDDATHTEQEAAVKASESRAKIDQSFFDASLKAYQSYILDEQNLQDNANKQRLRTLEDAQRDLRQLAAAGDVAGFVERQERAKTDLKRQAEDADEAARKRQDQFEREVQAAEQAHQRQLDDLNRTLQEEKQARDAAAAQRIKDIQDQGQEANNRAAQLEQELNDIREQWRRDDLERQRAAEEQAYQDRLNLQIEKQNEILAETGKFFNQWLGQIQQAVTGNYNFLGWIGGTISNIRSAFGFQGGLPYVPRDNFPAWLHEGERVLTRQENVDYTMHRGGDTYQISVVNQVGDLATKAMLDEYQETTINGITLGLQRAKGIGAYG